jgi:23S rRNA pseudouridine2605 synthase
LLLTDDGDLTYRLTHPSHHLAKVYELRTRGEVKPGWLQAARDGMRLTDKGEDLAPVRVEVKDVADGVSTMHLTLTQGVNRQIRRMCAEGDLTVLRLVRLRQGPLGLGDLQSGAVRVPAASEINALRQAVGL